MKYERDWKKAEKKSELLMFITQIFWLDIRLHFTKTLNIINGFAHLSKIKQNITTSPLRLCQLRHKWDSEVGQVFYGSCRGEIWGRIPERDLTGKGEQLPGAVMTTVLPPSWLFADWVHYKWHAVIIQGKILFPWDVIVKPKSKVQSPKVKTKRTWADTIITWATTTFRRRVARDQEWCPWFIQPKKFIC